MPQSPQSDSDKWRQQYEVERPTFAAYTAALETLLPQLLGNAGIPYVQIEGRTKEVSNFAGKLRRKQGRYEDPLRDVTDLSGLRIVLFYLDDVERVGEVIAKEFEVDPENSGDKKALLDPDRFGYLSVHHVVRPSASRKSLPEWESFAELKAEIQVRTVLQHAWGAISRKLAYATVREAPRDLQRNLNRLSALLELADDEFVAIRDERDRIETAYDAELGQGNLDIEIDESSLEIFIRESGASKRLEEIALAEGSPTETQKDDAFNLDSDTASEWRQERFRRLLALLDELGFVSLADLDEWLAGRWGEIRDFVRSVNAGYQDADGSPISSSPVVWLALILRWGQRMPRESYEAIDLVENLIDVILDLYEQH